MPTATGLMWRARRDLDSLDVEAGVDLVREALAKLGVRAAAYRCSLFTGRGRAAFCPSPVCMRMLSVALKVEIRILEEANAGQSVEELSARRDAMILAMRQALAGVQSA